MWLVVATGVVQLWMVWALALALGPHQRVRQPGPAELRHRDGRRRRPDERGRAEQRHRQLLAHRRPRGGRRAHDPASSVTGLSWIFLVNAATFAAVLAALLLMHAASSTVAEGVPARRGQVREGLRYAWGKWELRVPLLMMAVIGTLAFNFSVLLPLFASDVFHRGGGAYGAPAHGHGRRRARRLARRRLAPAAALQAAHDRDVRLRRPLARHRARADARRGADPAGADGRGQRRLHRPRQLAAAAALRRARCAAA